MVSFCRRGYPFCYNAWCMLGCFSCVQLFATPWSPPGSSVHGILKARILEWVVVRSSRGSSQPRDQTCVSSVSCIGRRVLYHYCHLEGHTPYEKRRKAPIALKGLQALKNWQKLKITCNVAETLTLVPFNFQNFWLCWAHKSWDHVTLIIGVTFHPCQISVTPFGQAIS